MALDARLRKRIEALLLLDRPGSGATGGSFGAGPRLLTDARRLWVHARRWLDQHLVGDDGHTDPAAIELACLALQFPMKRLSEASVGRFGHCNLRDRAEQAAEELLSECGDDADEALLDRTTALLRELPQRSPPSDAGKLLADVVNLEDFGFTGLVQHLLLLAARGQGIDQFLEAASKRDEYGYYEARIKDGFHFGPLRELARRRLTRARQAVELLRQELAEIER